MNNKSVLIAIIAGIAFVLGAVAVGISYYNTKKPQKTVSVVGLVEKDFTSDLIVWEFNYAVKDNDMKQSYSKIKAQNEIVKDYLKRSGIPDSEVDFKKITTAPTYRSYYANSRWNEDFDGYEARQVVRIESSSIEKIEALTRDIAELYDQNIMIVNNNPEYYYTKLSDLKLEMLAEASKNARLRAETVTQNAGAKLGDLKSANMGVFQITKPNSSDEDYTWGGAFNTSSKQKRASINMRLTYYVE
ncbi:MAG: SIMPL domain-containing protein [Bacteroidales bacterium]|nr:SIMPL domain-containing protein [Bacteroidales bacterium]MDY6347755.1 SIMPL domain-containing protein [Bacteroidales bacterium]